VPLTRRGASVILLPDISTAYRRVTRDIPAMTAPLLVLAAGADQATSPEGNEAFDRALTEAGKEHEYVLYDGAPHSFFDRGFTEWTSACEDAWVRMLGFIDRFR
jgi:carboxymethylenebutenolidase